jgi:hypothetical protein
MGDMDDTSRNVLSADGHGVLNWRSNLQKALRRLTRLTRLRTHSTIQYAPSAPYCPVHRAPCTYWRRGVGTATATEGFAWDEMHFGASPSAS